VLLRTFAEFLEDGKNLAPLVEKGVKVAVFKEAGKDDLCLKDLLDNKELVVTDKHAYS